MKHCATTKFLYATLLILTLSVVLGVISLFPVNSGSYQSNVPTITVSGNVTNGNSIINGNFTLSPGEIYKQGMSSFYSNESIILSIQYPNTLNFSFAIVFPNTVNGIVQTSIVSNATNLSASNLNDFMVHTTSYYTQLYTTNITCFNATANYYEAVFSNSNGTGIIHLQAFIQEPKILVPYSWLTEASKIMFLLGLGSAMLVTLKIVFTNYSKFKLSTFKLTPLSKKNRRLLILLLLLSLIVWLIVIAVNSNPLGTFENWYTDNARDTYVASLFLKDSFKVFSQPLGTLANADNSTHKFVTWPQMPHLYPLGSILLFLPFGVLVQNGFDSTLIFKLEIAIFLIFATVCLYYFLKDFLKKDFAFRANPKLSFWYALLLKIAGILIIYYFLVVFAANGMFDSVAFLFCLFALVMFMTERYDYFFLLIAVSVFFKYQAGIFLLPLIIVGLIQLFQTNSLSSLLKNKAVIAGFVFGSASIFTASLSVPYLMVNNPQLIMSSFNAFSSNYSISSTVVTSWVMQAFIVLLMLSGTVAYAVYMINKNSLLSLSALFLLLPTLMLPYFQNWYLSYIFIYVLIAQGKRELEATMLWLILMIAIIFLSSVLL